MSNVGGGDNSSRDDTALFLEHINADEPLEIILRGHLWIESALIEVIRDALKVPDALKMDRLSFPQKIDLAVALGVFDSKQAPAYMKINQLRNKVAHQLASAIGEPEELELIQILSEEQQNSVGEHESRGFPYRLRVVIVSLWTYLHALVELQNQRKKIGELVRELGIAEMKRLIASSELQSPENLLDALNAIT